jgi:hypothetical protein
MAKIYSLNKILAANTTYVMEKDRYFVIKALGTNISAQVTAKVDGAPCGSIISDIAPVHKTTSNQLGPLDLGMKYIVVPPERQIKFETSGSGVVKVIGDLVVLAPGESVLPEHNARYNVQGKDYITYIAGTYSLGTGTAWSAGTEYTVLSLTPATIEEYLLNNIVGVSVSNVSGGISDGSVGIRFYLDGVPMDLLLSGTAQFGVDALAMPLPPAGTTEQTPFTLNAYPIDILGDHTFEVHAVNTSGGSLSPTSGNSITVKVEAVAQYMRKV